MEQETNHFKKEPWTYPQTVFPDNFKYAEFYNMYWKYNVEPPIGWFSFMSLGDLFILRISPMLI